MTLKGEPDQFSSSGRIPRVQWPPRTLGNSVHWWCSSHCHNIHYSLGGNGVQDGGTLRMANFPPESWRSAKPLPVAECVCPWCDQSLSIQSDGCVDADTNCREKGNLMFFSESCHCSSLSVYLWNVPYKKSSFSTPESMRVELAGAICMWVVVILIDTSLRVQACLSFSGKVNPTCLTYNVTLKLSRRSPLKCLSESEVGEDSRLASVTSVGIYDSVWKSFPGSGEHNGLKVPCVFTIRLCCLEDSSIWWRI